MKGKWWHKLDDGRIQCDLCPRDCKLHEGQRGLCFVRKMEGGEMHLATYGRSSGFCVDPVEKKPLNHFYPGTSILSFGTAGCNLACKFCQNWDISKSREMDRLQDEASPKRSPRGAEARLQSRGLHLQRPGDLCRVRDGHRRRLPRKGVQTVAVTAGYMHDAPRASSTPRWTPPTST
jgi:pyruvate formate lyase activating enzyme